MSNLSFGAKLRQLREEQDISLRELAKRVGVSGAFLSDVELGRRFPSTEIIVLIAKEIKVAVEELKKYDFRDEVETIRKMMFADPKAGMAFRSITNQLQKGLTPEELLKKISGKKGQ
jgi:transcriptional regulator with XRE-family HTH domain